MFRKALHAEAEVAAESTGANLAAPPTGPRQARARGAGTGGGAGPGGAARPAGERHERGDAGPGRHGAGGGRVVRAKQQQRRQLELQL